LAQDLPGMSAHVRMTANPARFKKYYQPNKDTREAAVMLLLINTTPDLHVLFIKRPNHPKDPHSGQISFPGGRLESEDANYEACALRETYEEIGVNPSDVKVLGALSKLYVFASNNMVFPFVGYLDAQPDYVIQEAEVDKVISVPVTYFDQKDVLRSKDITVRGHTLRDMPYYDLEGHTLWGATAMIFTEWIEIWRNLQAK